MAIVTVSNLDSIRWFFHRRRTGGRHNWRPRGPRPKTMLHFFVFYPWWPWPLTHKFELGLDFCTVHLTTKFHYPTFNHSQVIVLRNKLTNKQMLLKTSTLLRYAMPLGKPLINVLFTTYQQCIMHVTCQSWRWRCRMMLRVNWKSFVDQIIRLCIKVVCEILVSAAMIYV